MPPVTAWSLNLKNTSKHIAKQEPVTDSEHIAPIDLGQEIRRRRRLIDKTLKQVSDETGLSIGFLSQVERGRSTPSLSSLYNIAKSLETTIEAFVRHPRAVEAVTRKGQRETFKLGEIQKTYETFGRGFSGAKLNACILHRPSGHVTEVMHNEGEEFVYVIQGSVLYEIDGQKYVLNAGDTIHFQSDHPHRSATIGNETAVELWVGTLPLFLDP